MPRRRANIASLCLLLLVTAVVFGRLAGAEFTIWDDPHTIRDNPALRNPGIGTVTDYWRLIDADRLAQGQTINHRASLWVPLTYTVWTAIAVLAKVPSPAGGVELNPYVFHTANLVLHAGAGALVYFILRRICQRTSAAVIGALLFVVHPLQVEAVAWASGLKDVLAGGLSLGAILLYLMHADSAAQNPTRRLCWWATVAVFALACLAKPSAVVTPLLILLIDWLILRRDPRSIMLAVAPLFVVAIPIAMIARAAQSGADVTYTPWLLRPMVALDAMAFYTAKLVWPVNLCIDYGRTPGAILQSGQIAWTWLVPVTLTAVLAWRALRGPAAGVPLASLMLFFLAPLPVLGLLPFTFQNYSTTADHYVYLAMLGPALLVAHFLKGRPVRLYWWAAVPLAMLAIAAFMQTGAWINSRALFQHALATNPRSGVALNNLGTLAAADGDLAAAAAYFHAALEFNPNQALTYRNLRQVLTASGRADEAMTVAAREYDYLSTAPLARVGHAWLQPAYPILRTLARREFEQARSLAEQRLVEAPNDVDVISLAMLAGQLERQRPGDRGPPPDESTPAH